MKLNLPLDTADRIPKTFSGIISQESAWAFQQCITLFKQSLCGFKRALKMLSDKTRRLLATMTDPEALTLKYV